MIRRAALVIAFALIGALTIVAFAGVVDIGDTLSAHWGTGVWDRLGLGIAAVGALALLTGVASRAFGAAPVTGVTALTCLVLVTRSIMSYPAAADDAAAPMVLLRSRAELAALLALVVIVGAAAIWSVLRERRRAP